MSSSYLPWEFFRSHPFVINKEKPGLYALQNYDPFIERLILMGIPKKDVFEEYAFLSGPELSIEWIENNLIGLDFFSQSKSFIILQTELISKKVQQYLLEEEIDLASRFLILSFQKTSPFFKKLSENKEGEFYQISRPRFWENEQLLNFLCERSHLKLPRHIKSYLLDSLAAEPMEYLHALKLIALHFGASGLENVSVNDIEKVVRADHLDQFFLANLFNQKKDKELLEGLMKFSSDFDEIRGFFSFMQGHIHKIIDPTYMSNKKKLSQYDQGIQKANQLFSQDELTSEMNWFGQMEILAKSRSELLGQKLKTKLLSSY